MDFVGGQSLKREQEVGRIPCITIPNIFMLDLELKVRQGRNVFFKPMILPKNELTKSLFLPNSTVIELLCSFFGRIRG